MNQYRRIATLWKGEDLIKVVFFNIIDSKTNYYRAATSLNYFFDRELQKKDRHLHCSIGTVFERNRDLEYYSADFPNCKIEYAGNVWEMYKLINYDYKKKKYID